MFFCFKVALFRTNPWLKFRSDAFYTNSAYYLIGLNLGSDFLRHRLGLGLYLDIKFHDTYIQQN